MKITSALKLVSAAKLKKAQDAVTAMRPTEKLGELMSGFFEIISTSVYPNYRRKGIFKMFFNSNLLK